MAQAQVSGGGDHRQAIQRVLDESRAKTSIASYLINQPDRFFSSIVVAALKGNPTWYGVSMEDDARFFHSALKATCDHTDAAFYPKFKQWADDYFYIKHRKETRGIGGIFFDRLHAESGHTKEQLWDFVLAVGDTFAPPYRALMARHKAESFTEAQRQWQLLRRACGTMLDAPGTGKLPVGCRSTWSWSCGAQQRRSVRQAQPLTVPTATLQRRRRGLGWQTLALASRRAPRSCCTKG
jgi:hypothetical protein